ncbi:SDR family oxidoreductase [Vitiosangium sp. GDMCC 1.1324]|uniref:SDR family oxidoreductase n=1 Tax=Vitiosangium sp. (strain GDMCC 1.1324) TaxID=2138576 RepID=UPI000D3A8845|nr:SDR family oxidoreductase [Vitiosangium sp. GDMCC 1.1324]PTL77692.1 epimerase [Vitiosangium sp. GDMCC 1.1324]
MRVLILGIGGAVAQRVALRLRDSGHTVVGIDTRPWEDAPSDIEMHTVDLRKRAAEDVFRTRRPEAMVHMATVTSLRVQGEERHRINLGGTRVVFEHCRAYGVKHAVFVGRHTFYGAAPDSALYHTEDEPPKELASFPELADLVAADLYASTALWRYPELTTSVLRVCYTLGPSAQGTLATFLRGRRVPMVAGYDPLFQFMHEDDVAAAIALTVEKRARGVFNVAGPQPLPLSVIVRQAQRQPVPLPMVVLRQLIGRFGLPRLPPGALYHLQYPIVVDARAFQEATGFKYRSDEVQTIQSFLEAHPPPRPRREELFDRLEALGVLK